MQRNSENNSGEDKGIQIMEQNLADFRRDIYQRYGKKIAEKQQKAYYFKGTDGNWNCDGKKTEAENTLAKKNPAEKNMMERENVAVRGNRTEERNILEINDTRAENRKLGKGTEREENQILVGGTAGEKKQVLAAGNIREERRIFMGENVRDKNRILLKGNKIERGKLIKEKMSFVSLALGIFSVIGMILLFFY